MSILPASHDYTDKDFESLRARIFSLIDSVYPDWTDKAKANFGNVLAEIPAFCHDVLIFYQDQQAREGRFAFVQMRRNMQALAKLLGYQLGAAVAATCDVALTITNPDALTGAVTPSSTPVTVQTIEVTAPVKGELQGAVSFAPGEVTKTFPWKHQQTQAPYTVPSTGKADQKVLLPYAPFLWDSETVSTVTQGTFTRVDSFYNSGPTDAHYRVAIDQNDRAEVLFGDGKNGAIPVGNIALAGATGGGVTGNVEAGALVKVVGTFTDAAGRPAYMSATNTLGASGGYPREEVAAARVNVPESITTVTRTVCRTDYEVNAKRVPGVGRTLMLTSNQDSGIDENRGKLYIIPLTGGTPSQSLLDDVETMVTVTYPKTVTFQLDVLAVIYLTINVKATVFFAQGTKKKTVKQVIIDALEDYFEPMMADGTENPNVDFGWNYKDADGNPAGEIPFSDIFNEVRDVVGIRKVGPGETEFTLNGVHDDVLIPSFKFPALGNVTIIDGDTGNEV